ncbi:MAG: hypothetical protein OXF26_05835 [Alphaproteobacteria bacterium]|nr:hypothetical protein [Alphaproteobacteria bacterium]
MTAPPAATLAQLEAAGVESGRPLLISDADEVLFRFVEAFVGHIGERGFTFDWSSFRLTGNVRRTADDVVLDQTQVSGLLQRFFAECTEDIPPVPGAADGLARLARAGAQIVVLTNVPPAQRDARRLALARNRMPYPVVVNTGHKGPAAAWLAARSKGPAVFVDDGPNNHVSVKQAAPEIACLHFVATDRLARLVDMPPEADGRPEDWPALERAVAASLELTCGGT